MRQMLYLAILATSSCATKCYRAPVEPPKGQLCTYRSELKAAFCADISTGEARQPVVSDEMDRWIVFDPTSYEALMNYIDALKE